MLSLLLAAATLQGSEKLPLETPVLPQYYQAPSYGPSLSEFTLRVRVKGKGVLTFPAPNDYSGQTLIGLKVSSEPDTALSRWKLERRSQGLNMILRATVDAPQGAWVSYSARVMEPGYEVTRTQGKNGKDWLASSKLVQSSDPVIRMLSIKLSPKEGDREAFAGKVARWVAKNKTSMGSTAPADARSTYTQGGDFLGRANFAASILRAANIPARVLAVVPTWAKDRDGLVWLTEYQAEGGQWEMINPTVGIQYVPRNTMQILAIVSIADEESAGKPGAFRADAPYLATPQAEGGLEFVEKGPLATQKLIQTMPRSAGPRVMVGAFRRSLKVIESGLKGEPLWFDENAFQDALAKGPINFALFLDGKPTMPRAR